MSVFCQQNNEFHILSSSLLYESLFSFFFEGNLKNRKEYQNTELHRIYFLRLSTINNESPFHQSGDSASVMFCCVLLLF